MISFPTLSKNPVHISFKRVPDPLAQMLSSANPVFAKSGRLPKRKIWTVTYKYLSESDKSTLQTFEKSTVYYGALSFQWTNVASKQNYKVKFNSPLKFEAVNAKSVRYNCTIELVGAGSYGMGTYGSGFFGY